MQITPNQIAAAIGGKVEGDGDIAITGFGKIEEATRGMISFIANPKYAHFIHTTKASAIIVNEDFDAGSDVHPTLIRVKDAYSALAELLSAFEATKPQKSGIENPSWIADGVMIPENAYIGAFAYIGAGTILGKDVKIYPHAYVGDGCEIGEGTIIRSGVKIYEGCKIGRHCIIHSGSVIGADGFGFAPKGDIYEKIPQIGNVEIEDYVEIGANCCIDRATFGHTRIGKGTKIDNLMQIAHNVEIGENNVFAAQSGIAGSTKIGNSNRIGGQCGFAGHITIGNHNEIGAQSGIPNSVGDNKRLMGYPAIDARQWAKNRVYLKRLGKYFESH